MGLLDALKRDKSSLTIQVEPERALPGDEVRIRVTVDGELDDKVQGLRAGIRCINRYLVREYDHDHDHDRMREVWRSLALHEESHELPLQAGTHEVTCVVPPHALPSSADAVGWWAWAHLDRRKGLDVKESVKFAVPLRAEAVGTAAPPAPAEEGLELADLPAHARAGEELRGMLLVAPAEDLKVTGIEVKLRRVRTYSGEKLEGVDMDRIGTIEVGGKAITFRDGGITIGSSASTVIKKDVVAEVEACGKQEFRGGDTAQVPFAIPLPADAGPSVAAPHTVVTWEIEATAKRRMRGDHDIKAPLVVVNA